MSRINRTVFLSIFLFINFGCGQKYVVSNFSVTDAVGAPIGGVGVFYSPEKETAEYQIMSVNSFVGETDERGKLSNKITLSPRRNIILIKDGYLKKELRYDEVLERSDSNKAINVILFRNLSTY